MGCNCAQRRNLTAQAVNNIRKGDVAAARQNAQKFAQSLRQDARKIGSVVRSALNSRPR
jgi:hypothetical protein